MHIAHTHFEKQQAEESLYRIVTNLFYALMLTRQKFYVSVHTSKQWTGCQATQKLK